jgi:hypothetical protein
MGFIVKFSVQFHPVGGVIRNWMPQRQGPTEADAAIQPPGKKHMQTFSATGTSFMYRYLLYHYRSFLLDTDNKKVTGLPVRYSRS